MHRNGRLLPAVAEENSSALPVALCSLEDSK